MFKQSLYPRPNVRKPQFPFDTYHEQIADELIERVQKLTATLQP